MAKSYASVFRPGLFNDQVVIVTGGGSGIGRCTAHELASLGARVALIGRNPEKLNAVREEIAAAGGEAERWVCDIREENTVKATIAAVLARFSRLDGLVNNAGGQFAAPLAQMTQKGWDAVVRNNLTGGFLMAREAYTQWMSRHGGAIVNIVADVWLGTPLMAHSGAARAGMINLTKTAAFEWSGSNVRVNAVAPGWIASSGLDRYPPEMGEKIRSLKNHVPAGRLGTESEVAAAIVFLLSQAAAFISGATLCVDGAAPAAPRSLPLPPREVPMPAFDGFHLTSTPKVLRD
ncbi:MAG TPA: SDR family oxidoreductase [Hyphomicrobiaceae bacterium]|jgi:citronellol/citronellal dehydrogenase|nr:SDR family oxidoreductase [Hyphomicrobiaceae bacterium]